MSKRETLLAGFLGLLFAVGVLGGGGYLGIYLPVVSRTASAERLEVETQEKREKLRAFLKEKPRLTLALGRSLPADADLARQEYEAAIGRLLREAKVPRGYTVRSRSPDSRAVPELAPKKPAYQRLAFEVTMKKVDLATLTNFLERYYRMELLHQITRLQIKRSESEAAPVPGRRAVAATTERADLDVTLVTEAAILDGAEARRTLLPVPLAAGALFGSLGRHVLGETPDLARALKPPGLQPVLAAVGRDYLAMVAKDPFHGPLPPPPAPVPVAAEPPPPPKEDVSPFIKLTGITRRSDGSATADVKDAANNLDYTVDLKWDGAKVSAKVEKHFYLKDRRKREESGPDLVIGDDSSSTARHFRVLGLVEEGLVLATSGLGDAKPSGRLGARRVASAPAATPELAIGGGLWSARPVEKVYVWVVGQPLRAVAELPPSEGREVAERARGGWEPAGTKPVPVAAPENGPEAPAATAGF